MLLTLLMFFFFVQRTCSLLRALHLPLLPLGWEGETQSALLLLSLPLQQLLLLVWWQGQTQCTLIFLVF